MDDGQKSDTEEPNNSKEEEEEEKDDGLQWLLGANSIEAMSAPMDTMSRPIDPVENVDSKVFTRERIFKAVSRRDPTLLNGLLEYLRVHKKQLTDPEFKDEMNGKTALLKALLKLKEGRNDTVKVLLDIAEKTGDLEELINASYKDPYYKGQTALHMAIERRSFDYVKLLVEKGADVQAKASGVFFQPTGRFYFGELPLSLAACTNQPDIVSFLMENPHRRADVTDKDSQGNTVLHALVLIADHKAENTEMIAAMYDLILVQHFKLQDKGKVRLEAIENNQGLTPLKLAAKMGKVGLFKHMLHREFVEEEMKPLSRKFTEWVYGPVRCSLFDTSSIDTNEENSVLDIIVFGSEIPNRPEMLQIEPLRSLIEDKWDRFASKVFLMNFLIYWIYVIIFTAVAFYRKKGKPPFPIEPTPVDYARSVGELISVLGAVWFFYKAIITFRRKRPSFRSLYTDGFCDILFFLQAVLLLVSTVLYFSGRKEYVGLLVISLAIAWINVLYYSRGSKQMGIYSVMTERMILGDLLQFLCVYSVWLFGFSAAVVVLIGGPPDKKRRNATVTPDEDPEDPCAKPTYNNLRYTILEMFKFTIGMGDLQFTDHVLFKEVFYILLVSYIVLTYILLLNMLIALMGNTTEKISQESENIWKLQRSLTILDMERTLPRFLTKKLYTKSKKIVCLGNEPDERRRFFRVEEMNWKQWRSEVGVIEQDEEEEPEIKPQTHRTHGHLWNLRPFMERIRARRHQTGNPSIP